VLCYFCLEPLSAEDEIDYHHPDKGGDPEWTEACHRTCHHKFHQDAGHFKEWGSWSAFAGRDGYERVMKKWPGFHHMGGVARARTARRNECGQFVKREE